MTGPLAEPQSLPAELLPYLEELVQRIREVCGQRLVSVFAVGSIALGDYRHGRSDIDITVVVDPSLPPSASADLVAQLTDIDCPAPGLELVLYDTEFATRPSRDAGFRLNLDAGPLLPHRVAYDPAGSPAFWYVIDRAIGHQCGRLLYGRPVREVLAAPAREDQLAAVLASVREHAQGPGHLADNQVLNGCRAVVFCRTGRWVAKCAAAQLILDSEPAFRPLVEEAIRSFWRPRAQALSLPPDQVREFLVWVRADVERTVRASVQESGQASPGSPGTPGFG